MRKEKKTCEIPMRQGREGARGERVMKRTLKQLYDHHSRESSRGPVHTWGDEKHQRHARLANNYLYKINKSKKKKKRLPGSFPMEPDGHP